jgi:acyl dehydratase
VLERLAMGEKLYYEDIKVGVPVAFGRKRVSRDEIVSFARSYDPQPAHLDEASEGGPCASGIHSCAILMRMLCEHVLNRTFALGSPGVDEVKWLVPVRPGDELTARYTCLEQRTLASRPHVGMSKIFIETLNQNGEVVMTWLTNQFTQVRDPRPASRQVGAGSARGNRRALLPDLWDGPTRPMADDTGAFFEDRNVGETTDLGRHTFLKDEIIAFAREFDPQGFHLDETAAKASLFGGLCASGWHTAAVYVRQRVRNRQRHAERARARGVRPALYGPSPGLKNLIWPKPLYAGETIEFRERVVEKVDLKSRPDRGLLVSEAQGRNERGEIVFAMTTQVLVERREPYRA